MISSLLVRRYVIQETIVVPAEGRSRKGSRDRALEAHLFSASAGVIELVGELRVLQGETGRVYIHTWAFVPYLATAAVGLGMIGLAALATLHYLNPSRTPKA